MEEKNDELLTHWMNFLVRKGLGADVGVTFTARAEEEKDHHHQDEEENHGI